AGQAPKVVVDNTPIPTENPFTGNPEAITEGKRLFGLYGCTGCHGANGGGGMWPSVLDDSWTYRGGGGAPSNALRGRPAKQKMPNFAGVVSIEEAGKILAFVRSGSFSGYNGKGAAPKPFDPNPLPDGQKGTLEAVALPKKNPFTGKAPKIKQGMKLW